MKPPSKHRGKPSRPSGRTPARRTASGKADEGRGSTDAPKSRSEGSKTRSETKVQMTAWGITPERKKKPERPTKPAAGAQQGTPGASAKPSPAPRTPRIVRAPRKHKGGAATVNPHPAHARAADGEDGPQRIAKLLARAGIASRREIERMIAEGRVALDGVMLDTPATLLDSLRGVTVDGNLVAEAEETKLYLFHKPGGCLTAERDPAGRPTIYDRLPPGLPRLMPIGRLDMNTEGLLLLTTDGGFKREMELPASGVERTYRARAFGEVSQAQLEELIEGIEIDGIRYGSIDANLERRTGANQWIEMTLTEGKNREVRRVLEHLGLKVNRLIRTRYGPFELLDMPLGSVVEITAQELGMFRKSFDVMKAKPKKAQD